MYWVSALLPRHLESLLSFLGSELQWDAPGRPSGELEAAGARPSLCSPHLPPGAGCGECRLITQLAAPSRPPPFPHHLQPGSARNTLWLLPSTHGLQPRVLPWPPRPCPGPYGGTKVEAGEGPAERRSQPACWVQAQVEKQQGGGTLL